VSVSRARGQTGLGDSGNGADGRTLQSIVTCVSGFRVLFVCIGNVCRSPLGERLLAKRLEDSDVEVSSAGVAAMVGAPMTPESAIHLEPAGANADGFLARQLTRAMVEESDLVLTATREIRSRVLEDSPAALRRTFTVLELAALFDVIDAEGDAATRVRRASEERSRAALDDYDIADPYGRDEAAYAHAAELMTAAVDKIAKGLS
jgi:low molecular weight protein-tyrosine phosphatase